MNPASRRVLELDPGLIVPSPENPRRRFDEHGLQELAASLRRHGLLQPILVRRVAATDAYEIVAGERRWRAARMAGLAKVPALLAEEATAAELAEWRLVENLQREELDPIALAQAYDALLRGQNLSQDELADRLGKSRAAVANTLRLLRLPPRVQELVATGKLPMGQARPLIGLPMATAETLADRAVAEGLSARAVEALARQSVRGPPAVSPAHIRELEAKLGRLFDAQVHIDERGDGGGKLVIHFHAHEHFDAVVRQLEAAFHLAKKKSEGT